MRRLLLYLLLTYTAAEGLRAAGGDDAVGALTALGFENVRVGESPDGTVYASLEPAGYRGTYHGAAAALRQLAESYPAAHSFRLLLLEDQAPRVALTATRADSLWTVKGDYDFRDIRQALCSTPVARSSRGRVDISVFPMFTWINHRLDQPFEYVLSIAPAIQTSLWPGNRIILQPVFPVSYDVKTISNQRFVHIGVAGIAQDLVSRNGRWAASLMGGFFLYDRIGADLRVDYRATPRLTLSAEASLTGEAVVIDKRYEISTPRQFSFFGKASYYEPCTRLQGDVMAGRFVYGDYGVRVDISRHFSDYTIGLYGVLTGGEHNAGFHFAIPLGPKHYRRKGAVRIKLPDYFDWEYSMVSYYEFYNERMGERIETRPDENRSAHYWQATHVAQYTERTLNRQ